MRVQKAERIIKKERKTSSSAIWFTIAVLIPLKTFMMHYVRFRILNEPIVVSPWSVRVHYDSRSFINLMDLVN